MILIDSIYICNSGGLVLLNYLVENSINISDVFYLFDERIKGVYDEKKFNNNTLYLKASEKSRKTFYIKNFDNIKCVLCFGNVPPPIRLNCIVYTYFHNLHILKNPIEFNIKNRFLFLLKYAYIKHKKNNTDFWILQTSFGGKLISRKMNEPFSKVLIIPFFNVPKLNMSQKSNDYVYISNFTPSKNHFFLLDLWEKLLINGYKPCLHLTVSFENINLVSRINELNNKGANIINHGQVPHDAIFRLLLHSKYTIYPSKNESFGLGIVEAISLGCKLIAPNLPYINAICIPSAVYDYGSLTSAMEQVMSSFDGELPDSQLVVYDKINELIKLLK